MDDTKFNISGNDGENKDNKDSQSDGFEFKIEKPKKDYSPNEQKNELPEEGREEEQKGEGEFPLESTPEQEVIREGQEEEIPKEKEPVREKLPEEEEPSEPEEPAKPDNQELGYIEREPGVEVEEAPQGLKEEGNKLKEVLDKFREAAKKPSLTRVLFVIAAILVLTNLFFAVVISSAKRKIRDNAILANKFALEKDDIKKEKEELEAKIDDLERNVPIAKEVQGQIYEEKAELEKQLKEQAKYYENKYNKEIEASLEKYADEAKSMAKKLLTFNKAYERDKKAYHALLIENKELKKSTAELNNKIKAFSKNHAAREAVFLYNLGVAYARGRLYDEAIKAFSDSLAQGPDNPEAHYNLAIIYETVKGDNTRAIGHLEAYLKSVPDTIERYRLEVKIDSLKRVLGKKKKYPALDSVSDFAK